MARSRRDDTVVSRPERVLFPGDGITKGELVAWYRDTASLIVPHLARRPLVMQRFPDGIGAPGFYHKQIPDYFPDWIHRVRVEKEGGTVEHVVCDNVATLTYLANQGMITPHIWLARVDRPRYPDRMVFDLDPATDDFEPIREGARRLRALLEALGLVAYLMTTGGRGLHLLVPLDRGAGVGVVHRFAAAVAGLLAARHPECLTTAVRKAGREGKVFVGYLRNGYAQTAVAPFAVRARPGAPVATPLAWPELDDPELSGRRYTMRNLGDRLSRVGDPWKGLTRRARSLTRPAARLARAALDRT